MALSRAGYISTLKKKSRDIYIFLRDTSIFLRDIYIFLTVSNKNQKELHH